MRIYFYSYPISSVNSEQDEISGNAKDIHCLGIGYTRIILASLSLYYMPWHPKVCVSLYCISCLLDAVDGNAARYFNQCKCLVYEDVEWRDIECNTHTRQSIWRCVGHGDR